jgi:hypothetical protein
MNTIRINWKKPSNRKLLLSAVENSPTNLRSAFATVAQQLNCSAKAVEQQWYNKFRNTVKGFTVDSKKSHATNVKNNPRKSDGTLIHEAVISTAEVDGLRIVTIKKYFKD